MVFEWSAVAGILLALSLGSFLGYGLRSLVARSERQALIAQLEAKHLAAQSAQAAREQLFQQNHQTLLDQFRLLAAEILDDRAKHFSQHSEQQLGHLINPLRERLTEFRSKLDEVQMQDLERVASLKAELTQLKLMNQQMSQEAHRLATALQGQSKSQGLWGELILENVLERSGLRDGIDFRREVSFQTADGRKRPDAIIYLPQGKHLIIDAKVSLNAYTRYVNESDKHERERAMQAHLRAMLDRVHELASRAYHDMPGINAPEIVFMFVPVESAFSEAIRHEPELFQKALDKQIVIATPTTLLPSLQMVRQLWRFEEQHRNSTELADRASKVYKKLVNFVSSLESIGQSLDKARDSYEKALGQLVSGKGNLIQQAKEFESLGVAIHSKLPEPLVDRAMLELDASDAAFERQQASEDSKRPLS